MEPMLNPLARLPVEKATGWRLFIKTVARPRIPTDHRSAARKIVGVLRHLPAHAGGLVLCVRLSRHCTRRKRTWVSW